MEKFGFCLFTCITRKIYDQLKTFVLFSHFSFRHIFLTHFEPLWFMYAPIPVFYYTFKPFHPSHMLEAQHFLNSQHFQLFVCDKVRDTYYYKGTRVKRLQKLYKDGLTLDPVYIPRVFRQKFQQIFVTNHYTDEEKVLWCGF